MMLQRWLEKLWYPDKISYWSVLYVPFDMLLGVLAYLRKFSYQVGVISSWRSPVPVVVVGNITIGGTGKTPLVIWLAQQLKSKGFTPGIISRGYGGSASTIVAVDIKSDPSIVGDEPLLIARRTSCPVWVGKKRPAVIRALLHANPKCDVIISDDGLQHYAMQRDFEIIVVDGERFYGNYAMLPFGPMREPVWRLQEVDALVINGEEADFWAGEYLMRFNGNTFYCLSDASKTAVAKDFEGLKVHAFAGIGNPSRFFNQLRQLGLIFTEHAFPDHHPYCASDLENVDAEVIIMTEKDAVKCLDFGLNNVWVLPVEVEVISGLEDKIIEKIEGCDGCQIT